ncbi:MAG TPA: glutamine amidotransferase family protein [Candidatus Lokiarchaeia archaeon]|nr:glutamine amidotransferase family protein [Candidatus Lokiarchaeia archaeon]
MSKEITIMNFNNFTHCDAPFTDDKVFDGCGISAFINVDGKLENGARIANMVTCLQDRENGLGAGFAVYGCFPDRKDEYCFQIIAEDDTTKDKVKEFLQDKGTISYDEKIPVKSEMGLPRQPILWRYFFKPPSEVNEEAYDDYIVKLHMALNDSFQRKAFVMSAGKNCMALKGNGWSREIAEYYQLENYEGCMWLGHSRFPTNTPGSWFGAHPFSLLSWNVIHNGEITSYGTNRRYLEMFGYKCLLGTDTEVIAYLFDQLVRRHKIPVPIAALAFNPPLYDTIDKMPYEQQLTMKNIRMTYRSALLNGPFSIVVGSEINGKPAMIGLTDRKKLRPQLVAQSDDEKTYFISSEEASFERLRLAEDATHADISKVWASHAGVPFIARLGDGVVRTGMEKPFEGIQLSINEYPPELGT